MTKAMLNNQAQLYLSCIP